MADRIALARNGSWHSHRATWRRCKSCSELHAITEGDDHVVAIARATGSGNGKTLDSNQVLIFHYDQSDRVTEVWVTAWDQYAVDDFWS